MTKVIQLHSRQYLLSRLIQESLERGLIESCLCVYEASPQDCDEEESTEDCSLYALVPASTTPKKKRQIELAGHDLRILLTGLLQGYFIGLKARGAK